MTANACMQKTFVLSLSLPIIFESRVGLVWVGKDSEREGIFLTLPPPLQQNYIYCKFIVLSLGTLFDSPQPFVSFIIQDGGMTLWLQFDIHQNAPVLQSISSINSKLEGLWTICTLSQLEDLSKCSFSNEVKDPLCMIMNETQTNNNYFF